MWPIADTAESRAQDQTAARLGVPVAWLMEQAGAAVARVARRLLPRRGRVLVLVGPGANGGDGLVAARLLAREHRVQVLLTRGIPKVAHGIALATAAKGYGAMVFETASPAPDWEAADLVIDAVLGTGCHRPVSPELAMPLEALARIAPEVPVLAVDLPSGIDSDTGAAWGPEIQAATTVTFGCSKRGHWTYPGARLRGQLVVADIGLPPAAVRAALLPAATAREWVPGVREDRHKGSRGRVLVIGGSWGMAGAPAMAAEAALTTGAGLVELLVPASVRDQVPVSAAVMVVPGQESTTGSLVLRPEDFTRIERADAVVIGPGLSQRVALGDVAEVIRRARRVVVDADALNLLAGRDGGLDLLPGPHRAVLTPHPGEAARLLRTTRDAVEVDRFRAVRSIEQGYGATVLLKGPYTLVDDGDWVWVNPTGRPELATAGSGDVLSGMVGAFLAQGLAGGEAAALAAYVHGVAAGVAAEDVGSRGVRAPDLVRSLGRALDRVADGRPDNGRWPELIG